MYVCICTYAQTLTKCIPKYAYRNNNTKHLENTHLTISHLCVVILAESLTNDTCQRLPFSTTSPSSPSSTSATTKDVPSIWSRYNKLLTYVVVGGGCGVGLVLMFIILLCLLAGCVASKNRKKARSRHQLNTGRRSHQSSNVFCKQIFHSLLFF